MRTIALGFLGFFGVVLFAYNAHAQSCQTDADCPAGSACELQPQPIPPCIPDLQCPPIPDPVGTCEAQEIPCETDTDCPNGLGCVEQEGGDSAVDCTGPRVPGADGGAACMQPAPQPVERTCGLKLQGCTTDADCIDDYECTAIESSESTCSSEGPSCAGAGCPPPAPVVCDEPDPPMLICFPARMDCNSSDDCLPDWSCTTLDAQQQQHNPPGWEGASQICLPDGIALAVAGRIEIGDAEPPIEPPSSGDSGRPVAGSDPGAGQAGAAGASAGNGDVEDDFASSPDAGGDGDDSAQDADASSDESGCSVARIAHRELAATPMLLALTALALALTRRRARR